MRIDLKKAVVMALALTMALGLIACSASSQPEQDPTAPIQIVDKPAHIGACTDLGTPLADLRVR